MAKRNQYLENEYLKVRLTVGFCVLPQMLMWLTNEQSIDLGWKNF